MQKIYGDNIKRILDIFIAVLVILALFPIYIIFSILIYLQDFHSPFYTHIRVGKDGRRFKFYKFRSMVVNADEILFNNKKMYKQMRSGKNKIINDPRITTVGKFIRKYSIDELPQMLNVLLGNMSIVGPRPLRPDEYDLYASKSKKYSKKLKEIVKVRPGITGIWQVSGRSKINFDDRIDMEIEYVKSLSFLTDLLILIRTPIEIIKGEGAY